MYAFSTYNTTYYFRCRITQVHTYKKYDKSEAAAVHVFAGICKMCLSNAAEAFQSDVNKLKQIQCKHNFS